MEFTDEDYKEIIYQSRSSYIKEMVDLLGMDSTLNSLDYLKGKPSQFQDLPIEILQTK